MAILTTVPDIRNGDALDATVIVNTVETAIAANQKSDNAVSTANTASSNASTALSTANTAKSQSDTAITNAAAAVTTSNNANANASAALSTANTAKSQSDTAIADSSQALSTAIAANQKSDNAVSTANTAEGKIDEAINTLQAMIDDGRVQLGNMVELPITLAKWVGDSAPYAITIFQSEHFLGDKIVAFALPNADTTGLDHMYDDLHYNSGNITLSSNIKWNGVIRIFGGVSEMTDGTARSLIDTINTKLATISTGAEVNPDILSVSEGQTGTATTKRTISAVNLRNIILYHSPAGARPASDVYAWAKAENKPTYSFSELINTPTTIDGYGITDAVKTNLVGAANGIATLDANRKVVLSQIPDVILGQMLHAGIWNASTAVATLTSAGKTILGTTSDTITLTNNTAAITGYKANQGNYFITQAAGTFASISFDIGDWLVANDSGWGKIDNTDAVASVNGKMGVVVLTASDVSAAPLSHVGSSGAAQHLVGTASVAGFSTNNYSDLSNRPTIPTVNNAALTVTQNNVTIGNTFTANDATARTYPIAAPDWNAAVGTQAEIKNKPTIPAAQVQTDWNATSGIGVLLNKPSTFTPSAHNHSASEITSGTLATARGGTGVDNSTDGTANTFFARPNGATGAATFRAIASADIPAAGSTAATKGAVYAGNNITIATDGRISASFGTVAPDIQTVTWTGAIGNYSYTRTAALHGKGVNPDVWCFWNGATIDCRAYVAANGDVTIYSNANVSGIVIKIK